MAGIKDLLSLQHWLNNDKDSTLEKALHNSRSLPKRKAQLLRELQKELSPGHVSDNQLKSLGESGLNARLT